MDNNLENFRMELWRETAKYKVLPERSEAVNTRVNGLLTRLRASERSAAASLGRLLLGKAQNSPAFDAMIRANQVALGDDRSGGKAYAAVVATKKYLEGKEGPRSTALGRERWKLAMGLLQARIPEKEFKDYCKHINEVRGVQDNPDSRDYISPEQFAPPQAAQPAPQAVQQNAGGPNRQQQRRQNGPAHMR